MGLDMFSSIDPWESLSHVINLLIAYALAFPIGWNREREERSAGIRTFPLVAMAACGFVLVAIGVLGEDSEGHARILEGLITGVGFIGAGAVLRVGQGQEVHGLATAACIWVTATIGAAAGLAVWPLIIGGLSLAMLVLFAGAPLERRIRERARLTPAEADRKDAERKP